MLQIDEHGDRIPDRRLFRKSEIADFWPTDKELPLPAEDNCLEIYRVATDGSGQRELIGDPQPLGLTRSTIEFLCGPGKYFVVLKNTANGKIYGNCSIEITKDKNPESAEIAMLRAELKENEEKINRLLAALEHRERETDRSPQDPLALMERMMTVISPLLAGKTEVEKAKIESETRLKETEIARNAELEAKKLEIKSEELRLQAAALREAAEREANLIERQIESSSMLSETTSKDAAQVIENYLSSFFNKNPQFGFLGSILKPALSPLTHALIGALSKAGIHIISDAELAERDKIYRDQIEALKEKAKEIAKQAYKRGYSIGLADGAEMAAGEISPHDRELEDEEESEELLGELSEERREDTEVEEIVEDSRTEEDKQ